MIYLDNSATTRPFPEAVEAVDICLCEGYYNPSSAYGPAVEAERKVERYRARLAGAFYASPEEIIYTSGATESNNMAIFGVLSARHAPGRLITTRVEHPSVYEVFEHLRQKGADVCYLDVDAQGCVRLDQLEHLLTKDTALVSMMQVNNETGAVNDTAAAYDLIRRRAPHTLLHVDGVQAFCKLPFSRPYCDLYSISGHKFHAPKGIGALYLRRGVAFSGGLIGGGQERGIRSGTTNVPGIAGMGEALSVYARNQKAWIPHMRACKLRLYQNLSRIPDVCLNGPLADRGAPHILNMSFLGVKGETLLNALSERGILVSTGSACSAHKKGKNRVLSAMGVDGARLEGAIRFSLSPYNTPEEMDTAAGAISDIVLMLRKIRKR